MQGLFLGNVHAGFADIEAKQLGYLVVCEMRERRVPLTQVTGY